MVKEMSDEEVALTWPINSSWIDRGGGLRRVVEIRHCWMIWRRPHQSTVHKCHYSSWAREVGFPADGPTDDGSGEKA